MDVSTASVTGEQETRRLRLRHDLVFAELPTGTLVRHSDGGFVLRGKAIYKWLTTLAPFLDGTKTRDDLLAGLDEGRAAMVGRLVDALVDKAALSTVTGPMVDDGHDLAEFRQQIAYIEHYGENGVERFTAFREAAVKVVGEDAVADAIRHGLLINGLKRVVGAEEDLPGDGGGILVVTAVEGGVDRLVATLRDNTGTVLPVVRVGEKVVIGPLTGPGRVGDWTTAMIRLSHNDENGDAARLWQAAAAPGHTPAPPAMRPVHASLVGLMAAYDVFRDITKAPGAETDGAVVVVDLATGDAVREEVLPDPRLVEGRSTVPPEGFAADVDADAVAEERPIVGDDDHEHDDLQRFLRLVGAHVGIVTGFDDEEIDQNPVKIARSVVHPGVADSLPALGFALEAPGDARRRATENAILEHVVALGPLPATESEAARRIDADRLVLATGLGDAGSGGWTAGRSLDGEIVEVPTAAVYARGAANGPGAFERSSAGEGVGQDLTTAVRAGIRSALAYEGVAALARGEKIVEVDTSEMDETVGYLVRSAALLGLDFAVHVLPAAAPAVAVFAVRRGTGDYAVGTGADVSAATTDALLPLIGRTLTTGRPGLDRLLVPGVDPRAARVSAGDGPLPPAEPPLASALRSEGREAVVVETTPADVLATGAVRTVRVLLTRPR
ncbi:bacteriocin biosynthesis cyclodehydratase domain-containing protein [Stackebrandtia albiflava]|uniref:Bacteriocin biosynthesis cyclodehydratase domain-containing protein n=1 Tax=Stackebrandtia albiflava TaxID=406432 RepID=A0A562VBZ0_9ACTN|nr:TOMM precursor leader peptide-binding protein [Stackebrandtia albiflava]TWJ15378.1 bacteriocin biosynthesis cyclodehydratase domain-containing protein [Stackebrandtia albiflava]